MAPRAAARRSRRRPPAGRRAPASFLAGSHRLVRQEGILEAVGTDYLVLRQGDFSTGCDLYALKFIEFHDDPPV